MQWKDKYPKDIRPSYDELLSFFPPPIRELFLAFDRETHACFKVRNKYHKYLSGSGWTYGYGRSYNCELFTLSVGSGCFHVLGVPVNDSASLAAALAEVQKVYDGGFEERYAQISEKRKRIERAS